MKVSKKNIKKILMIKNDKIGDIILSSLAIREIKKEFPNSKIDFIASNANKQLIEKNNKIDKIYILDSSPRTLKDFLKYLKLSSAIRKQSYDLGIELRGSFSNIFLLLFLGRVKYKIGFYLQKMGRYFLDYPMKKDRDNMHATQARLNLLNKALNMKAVNNWPDIETDKQDEKETENLIKKNNLKNFICIAPDASVEKKQWPLEKFDLLIKTFAKKYPKEQIVLVGPMNYKIEWLKKMNPRSVVVANENLRIVFLLFQKSDLVIAHDGGAMHLAWAGKSKTLGLVQKDIHYTWIKPLGKNSRSINEEVKKITVEQVFNLAEKLLNKKN